MRSTLVPLKWFVEHKARKYIEEMIELDENAEHEALDDIGQQVHNAVKSFMTAMIRIGDFDDSLDVALNLFDLSITHWASHLWGSYGMEYADLLVLFDEPSLKLSKKVLKTHGISALQLWRSRIAKDPICLLESNSKCRAFLARTIQYMDEATTPAVLSTVVTTLVDGRLPQELIDMILSEALIEHGVPNSERLQNTWDHRDDLWTGRSQAASDCCLFAQRWGGDRVTFWSTSERKYIDFHCEPLMLLRMAGTLTRAHESAISRLELKSQHVAAFHIRCRGQHTEPFKIGFEFDKHGPYPPTHESDIVFEADHAVERDWNVSKPKGKERHD